MPTPPNEQGDGHAHIEVPPGHDDPGADQQASPGMKNSKGWDGKLRVPKTALLSNPEAISDSDYSDDDNVLVGEEIAADEGWFAYHSTRPIAWED